MTAELSYISEKIKASQNEDVIEFYMDQYEGLFERVQGVRAQIENNCK